MALFKRFGRLSVGLALGLGLATGAHTAAAADTIKLGYSGPLSGGGAMFGKNQVIGLEMAVKELKDQGGVEVAGKTYKVELVVMDDKYSPGEAGVNARRLVQDHKASVVFAGHTGGTFAMQSFNEQSNFLVVSYTSVPAVLERGNTLTVRTPASFHGYMEPFTRVSMERYGKKVGLIPGNHDYAKIWSSAFVPVWTAAGGEVVADNPLDYNKDTDFYSGVSRVLAAKPDVLFIGGASEPTALVAQQARELGFKGGFIVMDQAKLDEMARVVGGYGPLEGAVGVLPLADYGIEATDVFVERYRELYKSDPSYEAGLSYFGAHVMVEAMKHAGTISDAKAIRASLSDALQTLPKERNPAGYTDIDEHGGFGGLVPVGQIVDGKYELVQPAELEEQ